MSALLERLEAAGIPIGDLAKSAMIDIDPADFTDYDLEGFWHDRPVPFLFTGFGTTRTISAPHMIATLLHHLEIMKGQDIILIGSKGGYLAAIIDRMVGEEGSVTIVEPHEEVRLYTEDRLAMHRCSGEISVLRPNDFKDSEHISGSCERVLITGSVREIPNLIGDSVIDGGFVLGPFGGPFHQRLLKKEKQGGDWFDTDLGGVVFGPIDVGVSETSSLNPISIANHIEDAFELVDGMIEIDETTSARIRSLILALREMPSDVPHIDEESSEEEVMEHPVVDLLMSEIEWLGPLWPVFSEFLSIDLASPGSPEEAPDFAGGHEDLIP